LEPGERGGQFLAMPYDVSDDIRAIQVCMRLTRLMRGRSEAAWFKAAGQHLQRLRQHCSRTDWIELVRTECGLSSRRAYELMEIAAGKSVQEHRAELRRRQKKSREIKAERSSRTRSS